MLPRSKNARLSSMVTLVIDSLRSCHGTAPTASYRASWKNSPEPSSSRPVSGLLMRDTTRSPSAYTSP